jgi:formate-dependent nitrite reductase cytochrome c552 subunit
MRLLLKGLLTTLLCLFVATAALAQDCVTCHKQTTPNIVSGWELSKHSQNKIDCTMCHGDDHKSAQDFAKAKIPTPDTCAMCHEARVKQFKAGKHAAAWAAMKAMPTIHAQPVALREGMKGC